MIRIMYVVRLARHSPAQCLSTSKLVIEELEEFLRPMSSAHASFKLKRCVLKKLKMGRIDNPCNCA